ncbi:MAG: YciI family protein [Candidatus Binatia bacterium]
MLFVIIGRDGPNGKTLRPSLRAAHLDHVRRFEEGGHVALAGPFTDGAGSLLVVRFSSIEQAHEMAAADPYMTGGVFASVEVHPFLRVFPEKTP